jgi:hypothetical protein
VTDDAAHNESHIGCTPLSRREPNRPGTPIAAVDGDEAPDHRAAVTIELPSTLLLVR